MKFTKEKNRVRNPEIIFKNFSNIIEDSINKVVKKYHANYEELITYLKNNEPDIYSEIESNYKKIDSDIYKKYRKDNLSNFELDEWENDLKNWYVSIKKGLKKYQEFKEATIN